MASGQRAEAKVEDNFFVSLIEKLDKSCDKTFRPYRISFLMEESTLSYEA